jgi:hypothetical protein
MGQVAQELLVKEIMGEQLIRQYLLAEVVAAQMRLVVMQHLVNPEAVEMELHPQLLVHR